MEIVVTDLNDVMVLNLEEMECKRYESKNNE